MTAAPASPRPNGFTLVELLVVVAVAVVLLTIAAPSMRELIARQRLKSVNAELVTDLQYARTLAISRNQSISVKFQDGATMSCYVVYVASLIGSCDCTHTPGSVCSNGSEEVRTTQVPRSTDVQIVTVPAGQPPVAFSSDGMRNVATDYVLMTSRISGGAGKMQVTINATGRPTVCSPDQSVPGVPAC